MVQISELNKSTTKLVDNYERSLKALDEAQERVNRAAEDVKAAAEQLAERLLPLGYRPGELISVWVKPTRYASDVLYSISRLDDGHITITKRV